MANRPGFTVTDAFDAVDSNMKGYISRDDFRRLLEDYGVFANYRDVERVMDRFDENRDGIVSYGEFRNELNPRSRRTNYW